MADFTLHTVTAPPPIQAPPPAAPPKPPKAQSDHKAANPTTSPRGPAVVLSGALAKPADKSGQRAQADNGSQGQGSSQGSGQGLASGQHINHVI
jgi:hypothetical protein